MEEQRAHRADEVGEVDVGLAAGADKHVLRVVSHAHDFVGDNLRAGHAAAAAAAAAAEDDVDDHDECVVALRA